MPQNQNFRKTILPRTLPDLNSRQFHEGKWKGRTSGSPLDSSNTHPIPQSLQHDVKERYVSSQQTITRNQSASGPTQGSSRDTAVPTIIKLPVEKTDSKESGVLKIDGQRYDKIQTVEQAGQGILSMEDSDTFPLVCIKEKKGYSKVTGSLKPCFHVNIVALRAVFYHTDSVSMVYDYETGAMTLASVASCPSVEFSDADIATVSRDILYALQFIHSELKIGHGDVRDGNVLLTLSGSVKLANIGDSMLNNVTLKDRDSDLKATGTVAMNLADRTTKITKPDVTHWNFGASKILKEFISRTGEETLKNLLNHEFLQLAAPSWSLKPHLTKALKFDPTFRKMTSVS